MHPHADQSPNIHTLTNVLPLIDDVCAPLFLFQSFLQI